MVINITPDSHISDLGSVLSMTFLFFVDNVESFLQNKNNILVETFILLFFLPFHSWFHFFIKRFCLLHKRTMSAIPMEELAEAGMLLA